VDGPPVKKVKKEDQELAKTQNAAMFKIRDQLRQLPKKHLSNLLERNVEGFDGTGGESEVMETHAAVIDIIGVVLILT